MRFLSREAKIHRHLLSVHRVRLCRRSEKESARGSQYILSPTIGQRLLILIINSGGPPSLALNEAIPSALACLPAAFTLSIEPVSSYVVHRHTLRAPIIRSLSFGLRMDLNHDRRQFTCVLALGDSQGWVSRRER